ncbi:response regulator receiver modulated diguanylate cyclase [Humidesulfovibrio mexicanus]|uniref:diguanylate cyclase n=1 Tax=Humidesulfovibrio mexicanus TaxID=147047 RepID=A0A238ZGH7_9BACT|nr:diguanylate cyclase [Humidesulfovibrio mexicanus]SNR82437.1 response regulator receiver modulated diguanylate cyclase [Humidesulfovibrio mexicanus]
MGQDLYSRRKKAMLLSPDPELAELLQGLWPPEELDWTVFGHGRRAMEAIFNEPPDLLVVDNRLADMASGEVASIVKSENVYRQLPVVLCLDGEDLERDWDWARIEADDFLLRPFSPREARERIRLTLCRASRAMDANPLTKLPGNTSIISRIQELIDRKDGFALAYCDLDHFKSFNDKYGFSRGDEVLMMTARVIVNTIRGFPGVKSFVGHVGGDDFVFIVPAEIAEEACQRVVAAFDDIVPHFYDEEDRERGGIISTDRQGTVRSFPLMAVSIAVVFNTGGRLKHYGEASAIAMGLKKKAKENPKSSYVLDRRTE